MQLFELETSHGTIAAREEVLLHAVRAVLEAERAAYRATPADLVAALTWGDDLAVEPADDEDDEAA